MKRTFIQSFRPIIAVIACSAFSLVESMAADSATPANVTSTTLDGTVSLVIPDDPYQFWREYQFGAPSLSIPGVSGPSGDIDGDGLPNMLEYGAGSSPWFREPSWLPQHYVATGGFLGFQFYKSKDAGDVDLLTEFSSDLLHWHPTDELKWTPFASDLGNVVQYQVISPYSPIEQPSQFMRLQAVRPSLADLMRVLAELGATPEQLLNDCRIFTTPASPMQGALTMLPRRYGRPNYLINLYFINVGLYNFVETHKEVVKSYLNFYLSRLQTDFTVRDADIYADLQRVFVNDLPSDSDDAYAGTFLRLAAHFALAHPGDTWFANNVATLKSIAQANIVTQRKANKLVKTFQNGRSAYFSQARTDGSHYIFNDYGYLMDNVEVWAGLNEFVLALQAINDTAGAASYQAIRDDLCDGIHTALWDETNKAWKWADVNASATAGNYYPDFMCQYFPELYGLPHASGAAETQRRYDLAWKWITDHKPDWPRTTAWTPDAIDTSRHVYSDLALAVVATKRSELQNARSYLALAVRNWIPHWSRPSGHTPGTLISQIGYWQAMLKGTPPRKLTITPFNFTPFSTAQAGSTARSNAIILSGFTGYQTVLIPTGATLFVNGIARTGVTASVMAGDTIWLETQAPSTAGNFKLLTLKVGGYSTTWQVTAAVPAAVPPQATGTVSGYTPVSASVGENGSSQISIPIVVSPGTAGMSPKLAISYSSQGGNGLLGIGFNLTGLSVISRVGRTLAQDNARGGINLDSNDRYALDGQRLIAISGADGGNGTEYRLEFDPGSRIRSFGGTLGNPSRWEVETKAGLKLTFMTQVQGRSQPGNTPSAALSWAVDSIADTLGNEIQFIYDTAAASYGELLVNRILYTVNGNVALFAGQEITFAYESRPDTNIASIAGYDVQNTKRLARIESRALNLSNVMQVVRAYDFGYQQDALTNESELVTVTESGLGGVALPATQFTWPASNEAEPFITQSTPITGIASTTNLAGDYVVGDFDGDGKTDVLVWNAPGQPNRFTLFRSTGSGFATPIPTSIVLDQYTRDNLMVSGDFDGDTRLDMLLWSEADNRYRVYYSTASGTNFQSPVGTDIPRGNSDNPIIAADFNGDGRTDVLVWGMPGKGSTYSMLLAEQTHFQAPVVSNIPQNIGGQNKFIVGEFNGDGRTDLLVWNSAASFYDLYLCTGQGFAAPFRTNISSSFSVSGSNISGDFNGDGLTDIMVWDLPSNPGKFTNYRCVGGRFASPVNTTLTGGFDGTTANYQNVIDFNGDGKTDIFTWHAPLMNSRFNITLATGSGFRTPNVTGSVNNSTIIFPGDYNGDGKPDFLMWNSPTNGNFNLWLNEGPKPRLVERVTNGHGAYTKFDYKPLTDPGVHIIGVPAFYPSMNVFTPLYVVSSMISSNGVAADPFTGAGADQISENSVYYTYYGAWANAEGRGFQGFAGFLVSDTSRGVLSKTDYVIDPLLAGRPSSTLQYLATAPPGGSTKLSDSNNTWVVDTTTWPNGNKTYFVRENTAISREYEPNRPQGSPPIKTTTSSGSTYDAFGNLTRSFIDHGDGFTETTSNTYSNFTSSDWLIGRLTSSSVTKTATGKPTQTRTSSFGYNSATGLLISEVIEPTGGVLRLAKTYTHDAFGNILTSAYTASGQLPRTTTTTYSDDGRFLLTTTNALNHSETKTYDLLLGNVLSVTGPNGLTTSFEYDFLGRPVRELRADGTETLSAYRRVTAGVTNAPPRAVHYVVTQSSGSGPRTIWFDLLDRDIRNDVTAFDGRTTATHKAYSADGTLYVASDPFFVPYAVGEEPQYNIFYYDKALRQIQETATGGRITTTAYDGLTTVVTNPLNQTLSTTTNVMGWAVQTKDHENKVVTRSYDSYGNLLTVTDPENHVTSITYDQRGRKIAMTEPNSGVTTFAYNAFGELTSQTDAKGQTSTFTYDRLGRVTRRVEPSGTSIFTFDTAPKGIGQLVSESGPGFSRSYTYDALSRPSTVIETHGASTFSVSRSYDVYGRPDTLTYPTGFSVRNVYNAQGFLSSVVNAANGISYWQANATNARGQITLDTLGNGIQTTRAFNLYTGLVESIIGLRAQVVAQNETYAWNAIGNLTRRSDFRNPTTFEETFTYDTLNRLKRVDTTGATALTIDYDAIGNIVTRSDVGSFTYGEGGVGPHAVTSITGARAKTCAYDANGNRTHDGSTLISYSSFNKPVTMTRGGDSLQFAYDPDRNLYHQTITRTLVGGPPITTERDYVAGIYEKEVGTDGSVRHTHYISGGTGVVAIYTEAQTGATVTQTTRYVHKDHLGSVNAISESDGAVKERLSFDAWGRRRTLTYGMSGWLVVYDDATSAETHRGFTGHEMLDSMGLVHMNGRVYDPLTGRFLSPDPFVQSPDNLQNLNRYGYVLNNPLSYTDPSGFFFKSIGKFFKKHWKTIAAVAVGAFTGFVAAPALFGSFGALAAVQGAAFGFGSAFSGTLLAGGSVGDALRAGLKGGAIGGVSAGAAEMVGAGFSAGGRFAEFAGAKPFVHGVVQGGIRQATGGKFVHGFLSGSFSDLVAPSIGRIGGFEGEVAARTLAASVVGGTAEAIGGGKFANGAITGAFVHLFNGEKHRLQQDAPDSWQDSSGAMHQIGKDGVITNADSYWLWRQSLGDPFAELAIQIGKNEGMGALANWWLRQGGGSNFQYGSAQWKSLRLDLANAHQSMVMLDQTGVLGKLSVSQVRGYHHQQFHFHGLSPMRFGGTALFGYGSHLTSPIWASGSD